MVRYQLLIPEVRYLLFIPVDRYILLVPVVFAVLATSQAAAAFASSQVAAVFASYQVAAVFASNQVAAFQLLRYYSQDGAVSIGTHPQNQMTFCTRKGTHPNVHIFVEIIKCCTRIFFHFMAEREPPPLPKYLFASISTA